VQLALPSEGLACAFPATLAQLTALTTLDLTFNRLTGRCAQPGGSPSPPAPRRRPAPGDRRAGRRSAGRAASGG